MGLESYVPPLYQTEVHMVGANGASFQRATTDGNFVAIRWYYPDKEMEEALYSSYLDYRVYNAMLPRLWNKHVEFAANFGIDANQNPFDDAGVLKHLKELGYEG